MPDITEKPAAGAGQKTSTMRQIAWFMVLYGAGLLVTGLVVYFFRALLVML